MLKLLKRSEGDHSSDIRSIFTYRPTYQPSLVSLTPVPSDDKEEDTVKSTASARQSRYDKFEVERKFLEDMALAKLASLGKSSGKNNVSAGILMKGETISRKCKTTPSPDCTVEHENSKGEGFFASLS